MSAHRALIALVALASGIAAAAAPSAPTGSAPVDAVLVGGCVAVITLLGAATGRAALLILLLAGAASFSWIGLGSAIVLATAGYVLIVRPGWDRPIAAVAVGVAMNLVARSELGGFVGASAVIAAGLGAAVAVTGLRQRPPRDRRRVLIGAVVVGGVAIAGTAGFAISVWRAADDLRAGDAAADRGLDALGERDLDAARRAFEDARAAFERADSVVGSPVTALSSIVPGVAQHRRAVTTLSAEASTSAGTIVDQLADVDLSQFSVTGGRIDIERVRALEPALAAIDGQIRALRDAITDAESPWLVSPLTDRLERLTARLDRQLERSTNALAAARVAPGLLGGDGQRVYFVGFATPSEVRGLGGFIGNWAEVTITDGAIEVTATGRANDLDFNGDPGRRFTSDDPAFQDWLRRYGPYNITSGPGGSTGEEPWKNITMSPDMATTARAIAELYPQSGGRAIDGVIIMDVYALAEFLEFTGPVPFDVDDAEGGQVMLTTENARRFLLNEQYDETDKPERVDALGNFVDEVIDRLLGGALPPVDEVVDTLAPMVQQGRLMAWAERPDEQRVLEYFGMIGTLPTSPVSDALAVTFNNAAGSKIDYFMHAEAQYEVTADSRSSTAAGTLTIELTNTAPRSGEPEYVIGNLIGLPEQGVNRTWVSVYSKLPVTKVHIDGKPAVTEPGVEAGYFVTSVFVTLGSNESAELTFGFDGPLNVTDGYELDLRTPPVVRQMPHTVDATWIAGDGVDHHTVDTFETAGRHRVAVPGGE